MKTVKLQNPVAKNVHKVHRHQIHADKKTIQRKAFRVKIKKHNWLDG